MQIPVDRVGAIRFRGNGWPGAFSVHLKDGSEHPHKLSYKDAWGFLQTYRPFRCYLCPDGTSELADISCGDPWHRPPTEDEKGRSLIIVRTARGREILDGAVRSGYLALQKIDPTILEHSQKNLLMKRSSIWGRLLTMKTLGLPAPTYAGFPLLENWLELALSDKLRSLVGTAWRILQRRYYRPIFSYRS